MTKPVVHYKAIDPALIYVGISMIIWPMDHPSKLVSNKSAVYTSPVISKKDNGEFETENTIYIPNPEHKL